MKTLLPIVLALNLMVVVLPAVLGKEKFTLVKFTTEDGGSIQAAFFKAESAKAVVFAHGAVFNKESWYFLAEKLQGQNVASLAIDFRGYGKSKAGSTSRKMYDIIGAVNYLREQGFTEINIIGGSMGGAAVLAAWSFIKTPVSKVVLLAPAGGNPIKSGSTGKLFVVSQDEGLYDRVKEIYDNSAEPKQLKVFPGSTHAQHLFKTTYADELVNLILEFIGQG